MTNAIQTATLFAAVSPEGVNINRRARAVATPAMYHFELGTSRRELTTYDQEQKYIERGYHQVDPTRAPSENPVMPCSKLLAETGNAFPADFTATLVDTAERYQPRVAFAHKCFAVLAASTVPLTAIELANKVAPNVAAFPAAFDSAGKYRPVYDAVARDVLRDLALYQLASASDASHRTKTTKYAATTTTVLEVIPETVHHVLAIEGPATPTVEPLTIDCTAVEVTAPTSSAATTASKRGKRNRA